MSGHAIRKNNPILIAILEALVMADKSNEVSEALLEFMNRVVTRIAEIDGGEITVYSRQLRLLRERTPDPRDESRGGIRAATGDARERAAIHRTILRSSFMHIRQGCVNWRSQRHHFLSTGCTQPAVRMPGDGLKLR